MAESPVYVLGLSCFFHNSAASLTKDGLVIAAAEEERFSRTKNDPSFPAKAVNYCLEEAGIQTNDLSAIIHYEKAGIAFERFVHSHISVGAAGEDLWIDTVSSWLTHKLRVTEIVRDLLDFQGPILCDFHHRSHAASAFFPSPFETAAILTVDGVGEWATATISHGRRNKIEVLKEMQFPHSLGLLYSAFTEFVGFKANDGEYKLMGLAPYGQPSYVDRIKDHIVDLKSDGSVELNMEFFSFLGTDRMTNEAFAEVFDGPNRASKGRITKRDLDLARSVQQLLEESMVLMARYAREVTGENRLCVAGGVALNCVANTRLRLSGLYREIWIQPAAGDAGCALGAALDAYHCYFRMNRRCRKDGEAGAFDARLGPRYSACEIEAFLNSYDIPHNKLDSRKKARVLADMIASGKVIGMFSGRAEFGPRALGGRSILADPRDPGMQKVLNMKIKKRESFRPFAPAVLNFLANEYFYCDFSSPYMLFVVKVRERYRKDVEVCGERYWQDIIHEARSEFPAATHVDYTARIQTVDAKKDSELFDIIKEFWCRTGCGMLLNTSLNVKDEPIVLTPYDAYRCFMETEMDALILGDYLLCKTEQPEWSNDVARQNVSVSQNWRDKSARRQLRRAYKKHILPVLGMLGREGRGGISRKSGNSESTWKDVRSQVGEDISAAGETIDISNNVEDWIESITKDWMKNSAQEDLTVALKKYVTETYKHLRYLSKRDLRVPESIYAMY